MNVQRDVETFSASVNKVVCVEQGVDDDKKVREVAEACIMVEENVDCDWMLDVEFDLQPHSDKDKGLEVVEGCSVDLVVGGQVWDHQHPDVLLAEEVKRRGTPNIYGARIPVDSGWNLKLLQALLVDYHDQEIVEFIRYGWPANRLPWVPSPSVSNVNHRSATEHPEFVDQYIATEIELGATMGPFREIPFSGDGVGVSPLSTRPKRDSQDRRTILDLSYPPGRSVNDWIPKDNYLGFDIELKFPGVDNLARRVAALSPNCRMWKCDVRRCFRQVLLDPSSYELFGFIWKGLMYWDKVLVMGHQVAPYICQRITNALRFIHTSIGYFLLNYVDDFVGAELMEAAQVSYEVFGRLLESLGVQESLSKAVAPSPVIEFLGVGFDAVAGTMFVTEGCQQELLQELDTWRGKSVFSRKELESLIGKLQFITSCVRPGRVFMARLLNTLRGMPREDVSNVDEQLLKDIEWWRVYLPLYNGVSILWPVCEVEPNKWISTDACLTGIGGTFGKCRYFRYRLPPQWRGKNIAYLEMWAVIVTLKVWGSKLKGMRIVMNCDNEAVVQVVNRGKSWDLFLQAALHEVVFLLATEEVELRLQYIRSSENTLPDWLSRWYENQDSRVKFRHHTRDGSGIGC